MEGIKSNLICFSEVTPFSPKFSLGNRETWRVQRFRESRSEIDPWASFFPKRFFLACEKFANISCSFFPAASKQTPGKGREASHWKGWNLSDYLPLSRVLVPLLKLAVYIAIYLSTPNREMKHVLIFGIGKYLTSFSSHLRLFTHKRPCSVYYWVICALGFLSKYIFLHWRVLGVSLKPQFLCGSVP